MDISAVLGRRPLTVLPYHSYFNTGQGKNFYWRGAATKNCGGKRSQYSSMRDYDLPYQDKSPDPTIKDQQAIANVTYDDAWIGGSSVRLKCLSNSASYGLYKLLNLDYACDRGLAVKLKLKQGGRNKYSLLVNLQDGKQLRAVGVTTPIANSEWTQVNFTVEPSKA